MFAYYMYSFRRIRRKFRDIFGILACQFLAAFILLESLSVFSAGCQNSCFSVFGNSKAFLSITITDSNTESRNPVQLIIKGIKRWLRN